MSSYKLIGFSEDSDVTQLSIGFIIIIGYLVVAEKSLSVLDEACRETAYAQAVQSLYKELVIMGISGFVLTVLLGTSIVPTSGWVLYMEIADVTLFLSSLFHVFFSFSLILINLARHRDMKEMLKESVHDLVDRVQSLPAYKYVWNPFSSLRAQVELRVLRIMFLKQFKLDRAFDFARYITLSEEHHIIEMLHISPVDWAVVVALILLNFIRVHFKLEVVHFTGLVESLCLENDDIDERMTCETATFQCLLYALLLYGFVIVLILMAVVTRIYEWRLMRINGPQRHSDTCSYLLEDELDDVQGSNEGEDGRMTLQHMKQTIEDLKKVHEQRELRRKGNSGKHRDSKFYIATEERQNRSGKNSVFKQSTSARSRSAAVQPIQSVAEMKTTILAPKSSEAPETEEKSDDGRTERQSTIRYDGMLNVISQRRRSSARQSMLTQQRIILITHSGIQSGLFLFDSATFYFLTRDICNLLLCLYYALYLTTILAVSLKTMSPIRWIVLCVLGLIASIIFQSYVIRASSIINAVSQFNSDVVGRVIEDQEEDKEIEKTIRDKILNKLKQAVGVEHVTNTSRLKKAVHQLFNEIQKLDGISDNLVSKEELRVLLQKMNIFFSKSKFDRAFEIFDTDFSQTITLAEFVDFIFPDPAREERLKSRVLKLQERGLIKTPGLGPGTVGSGAKKRVSFHKIYRKFCKVRLALGLPTQKSKKYNVDNSDESEEVVEFKEKQKNIEARAARQVNREKLKINADVPQDDTRKTRSSKLYNTLAASKLILSRYRIRDSAKLDVSSKISSPKSVREDDPVCASISQKEFSDGSNKDNVIDSAQDTMSQVTSFSELPLLNTEPIIDPNTNMISEFEPVITPKLDRKPSQRAFQETDSKNPSAYGAADPVSEVTAFIEVSPKASQAVGGADIKRIISTKDCDIVDIKSDADK